MAEEQATPDNEFPDKHPEGLKVLFGAEMFERVTMAAEAAGFEYMLIPVQTACWEAWISGAMMVARSDRIKMLIAARPGYINPNYRRFLDRVLKIYGTNQPSFEKVLTAAE